MEANPKVSAHRVVLTSFIVDLSDVVLSLVVALLTGSVVMLSQVLEGAADLASSGLLWFGLLKAKKNPDPSHPFGYGREIYFWTLIAGLIMFVFTSGFSMYFGWQRVIHPEPVRDIPIALGVLVLTVATNGYAFYLSLTRLLKRRHLKHIVRVFFRSSLVETKTAFILDLMGTSASLLGIAALGLAFITNDDRYDGVGAIIIGIFLAFFSYLLLAGIRDLLVGRSASHETELKIMNAAEQVDDVNHVLQVKTMHLGTERLLVLLDVNLKSNLKTKEIEKLIDDIKEEVRKEVPQVKHIQVELETPVR